MKFTKEKLVKAMGLKVGDRISIPKRDRTYVITEDFMLQSENNSTIKFCPSGLIDEEFEILRPEKRLGDMKCGDFCCEDCPLKNIRCDLFHVEYNEKLYDILEDFVQDDQELYKLIKKRLDKEV